jgi:VWFA-related protein
MSQSSLLLQVVCAFILGSALAQDARVSISRDSRSHARGSTKQAAATFRVDSDLILVPVLVTDSAGRLVTGLDKPNFKLYEDNVEQQISHFASEDAPVSIALAFDTSGSMADKLKKSRLAVKELLKTSNPDDELSLISFSDRPRLLVPFTSDFGEIENRLTFLESRGRTALLDAICLAMDEMKQARHVRKAILLVSDGGDNSSRYHEREIRRRVREADVQIYSIGIMDLHSYWRTPEEAGGGKLLNDIASETGGRLFEIDNPNELPEIAAKIGTALRNQYVLGYSPSLPKRDGKYHRITVKLAPPKGSPKLKTSFRMSYLAPAR